MSREVPLHGFKKKFLNMKVKCFRKFLYITRIKAPSNPGKNLKGCSVRRQIIQGLEISNAETNNAGISNAKVIWG